MPPPAAIITSRTNPRVKQLRAAFAGTSRISGGLIAIEGSNLLEEALRSGLRPRAIYLSAHHEVPLWVPREIELLRLADAVFASATDTRSPQGIAALLEPPSWNLDDVLALSTPAVPGRPALFLVAAGLQDPGNLGTLIRTAEAFAATAVLTTEGTVSPWNPKALRASAGSVFRVPVAQIPTATLDRLRRNGVRILAAVTGDSAPHYSSSVPVTQLDLTTPCAFLIGNEGNGLTHDLLAAAETRITIPTPGPVESLNAAVAGALLLYEAARQRAAAHPHP
jgi:TrmH family RNA methyltransferase